LLSRFRRFGISRRSTSHFSACALGCLQNNRSQLSAGVLMLVAPGF